MHAVRNHCAAPACAAARRQSPRVRAFAVLALALLLGGCSMLGLIYNRLDSLVGFYIEDLVELSPEQSAQLERTLAGNLEWHRGSELQRYVAFLRDLAGTVDDGLEREQLLAASRRAEDYWREIVLQAAPGYTALALTFSDAQVEELIAGLAREDEKEYADIADLDATGRRAKREKSVRKLLERFTGTLTAPQRQLITDYVARTPSMIDEWRESRRRWCDALAQALRERADTPAFRARMTQLIARPDELWSPQYRRAVDDSRESFIALLVALDDSLSPAQRAATRRELLSLAKAVEKLARA